MPVSIVANLTIVVKDNSMPVSEKALNDAVPLILLVKNPHLSGNANSLNGNTFFRFYIHLENTSA